MNAEMIRLREADEKIRHWRRWGPYLSERQWGTVREDYSSTGDAWNYFPFEHSHLRTYRWGEDGILGISDNHQRLCFAVALWNGRDPILKERLFGLSNARGNHGEDVKELYYYVDSTPTHSYMRGLYKYPQAEYPYRRLIEENIRRGLGGREFEILDAGVFDEGRFFDVEVEYAKADVDEILILIRATNRGPETAPLHLLPTLWFRNRWSWGRPNRPRPAIWEVGPEVLHMRERQLGDFQFALEGAPRRLFTENDTNTESLYGFRSQTGFYKDGFNRAVVHGESAAVNPAQQGSKACGVYEWTLAPGESRALRCRLRPGHEPFEPWADFDSVFDLRRAEADEFYRGIQMPDLGEDARRIQRQAYAGLLWTKQYYHYVVEQWLEGDPAPPKPPASRVNGRNASWVHVFTDDILSMPDKWEYPWFAAWDTAFHMIPFARIDPGFAKHQLQLLLREWYLHPNGQIPAYEWAFGDVNPPVHAWACWRVFEIDAALNGAPDLLFLERVFHKLLMNFTWWVNRKDSIGDNIFEGGFLGLDNIGVFDRSKPLPTGGVLEQADGTSWMAMYSLNMLRIAVELAQADSAYEDIASKFFEHFLYIASAMNTMAGGGLWDEEEGFFFDRIRLPGGNLLPLRVRSLVGLIPLLAVEGADARLMDRMPGFQRRMEWFITHRPDLCTNLYMVMSGPGQTRAMLSLATQERLRRVLRVLLDEREFLSPYGIRSLSRRHLEEPFVLRVDGGEQCVAYNPAESDSRMFGGNSNWRGPIWFPVNYLLIEALRKYDLFFGESMQVECPTGSGRMMRLAGVADEISARLARIFLHDEKGRRPCFGDYELLQSDPQFRDLPLFHEYFHGETGAGLGASHQTGWTALIATLLDAQSGARL
jgi:hypothetical protein